LFVAAVCAAVAVVLPLLNLVTRETSPLHVSDFLITLVGKLSCYAIVAVAMDFVWGYAGILSL
jgi:urea transport system permease protein